MKYRNFRNTVAMVAFLGLGVSCWSCYGCWQSALAQEEADRQAAQKALSDQRAKDEKAAAAAALADAQNAAHASKRAADDAVLLQKTPGAYWSRAPGLRPLDKEVLLVLDRPVVEKIKDATSGKPYKVNVYSDDKKRFNRLKIDLDRDEKADESWTIKDDGTIERKVASNDDEKYDHSWRLDITSGWVSLDAPPPAAAAVTPASTPAAADGLRPVDNDMLALVKGPAQEKVKDATKGKSYKINLYSDDGARFNRAKTDLNRNDKWDESWTFGADGSVERQVAPADDEKYTEVWTLSGGAWKKK
ncbi:MAG: hypothetical protein Q8O67_14855 [Deltaproteobacteria bacterium]|nr:hypothetical protein [Deltaproteobacteria bacterium]